MHRPKVYRKWSSELGVHAIHVTSCCQPSGGPDGMRAQAIRRVTPGRPGAKRWGLAEKGEFSLEAVTRTTSSVLAPSSDALCS